MSNPSKPPIVDIGIPVHQRSEYVGEAIESVLAQTFQHWRLMISEDERAGDDIARRIEPYLADERISFVSTAEALGAARNLTQLIENGRAPYVALLHDDDRWGRDFLAGRVTFLDRHPACTFVFSTVTVIDAGGAPVERSRAWLREGIHDPASFVPKLLHHNIVPSPTVVARRTAYEAVGALFDFRLRRIYDHEMWLRLALQGPVGFVKDADAYWRVHDAQSSKSLADRIEEFEVFLELADVLVRDQLPTARLTRRERRRKQSDWLLTNALDAVEQGDARVAKLSLRHALRTYPLSAFDPRAPTAALALRLGSLGCVGVRMVRSTVRRHGIRAHVRAR